MRKGENYTTAGIVPSSVPPLTKEEKSRLLHQWSFKYLGCLTVASFAVLLAISAGVASALGFEGDRLNELISQIWVALAVVAAGFTGLFVLFTYRHGQKQLQKEKAQAVADELQQARYSEEQLQKEKARAAADEIQRARSEAAKLAHIVSHLVVSSGKSTTVLPALFDAASGCIRRAAEEYRQNAFAPFWDAVEESAQRLDNIRSCIEKLRKNAEEYYQVVPRGNHTFPPFPVKTNEIPDPRPIAEEFRHVVRLGQTDFQFAMIWEQRKTREVLIAGFRTLGEAVENLGNAMATSVSQLEATLSSTIADVAEEVSRSRDSAEERADEQVRMLDDIRHGRKPAF